MPEMPPSKKGGRPSRFAPELGERLIDLVVNRELPLGAACRAVGIGRRTLYDWLARGRRPDAPPELAAWVREFAGYLTAIRRDDRIYRTWLATRRSKASWQRFRRQRQAYWREHLGPEEFWSRRLVWLAARGLGEAYGRALATMAEEGLDVGEGGRVFPRTRTP